MRTFFRPRGPAPALRLAGFALAAVLAVEPAFASGTSPTSPAATPKQSTVAPSKHAGSGVVMRYSVPPKIAIGETVTVQLSFSGVSAPDGASVEIAEAGTRRVLSSLRLAPGVQREVEVSYTGLVDGMQYLNVTTTQAGRVTVQSVPLAVGSGKAAMKPAGTRQVTPSGEAVISLPAGK